MVRTVRLFDQTENDGAKLGPALGILHIEFSLSETPAGWGGKIRGSDYLVWGMNHRRITIEFEDGERASAVIRATGDLIGIGEPPPSLSQTHP